MLIPYAVQTCQGLKYFVQETVAAWDLYIYFSSYEVSSLVCAKFCLPGHPWKRVTICDYNGNCFPLGKWIFE